MLCSFHIPIHVEDRALYLVDLESSFCGFQAEGLHCIAQSFRVTDEQGVVHKRKSVASIAKLFGRCHQRGLERDCKEEGRGGVALTDSLAGENYLCFLTDSVEELGISAIREVEERNQRASLLSLTKLSQHKCSLNLIEPIADVQ